MIKLPPRWDADAACLGHMDEMFPQGVGLTRNQKQRYVIKTYCLQCPIIEVCKIKGKDEEFGVWGGRTEAERRSDRDWLRAFS